ncbi:MAG TPA: hypothetical protein VH309_14100, partial [Elusimicrobiota bacterium]|nr:hypothetical protein [Elusimicrobiota bacterium]
DQVLSKYPDIGAEFPTLQDALWTNKMGEAWFEKSVKDKYGAMRPQAGLEAEKNNPPAETLFQAAARKAKELLGGGKDEEKPLEQAAPGGHRGYFDPVRKVIGLMKSADASTFLHESAHAWLEDEFGYIRSGKASEEYLKDWKVLGDWLGVKDGDKKLSRDQHEQFAKGFESYLSEGKAPSRGLRRVFAGIQRWLTGIYRDAHASLGVKLNPEVRGVMDRMLATDAEIKEASRAHGMMTDEDLSHLDPEEASWIRASQQDAHDDAVSELMREQMPETTAKHAKFLADERDRVEKQMTKDLRDQPVYKATEELKKWFGESRDAKAVAFDYRSEKLDERARVKFDDIAEKHGFVNGDELAQTLAASPSLADKIKGSVDAYMAQYADLKDTDKMQDAAARAIHNDKQLELISLESQAMGGAGRKEAVSPEDRARRRQEAYVTAQAARQRARELLARKSSVEAGAYGPYITAERNAAVKAARAMMKGDYEGAQAAKTQQLLNHAMAMEAMKNRAESERVLKFLGKYADRKQDFKNMPFGFISKIDGLLETAGLKVPRPEDLETNASIAGKLAAEGKSAGEIADATGMTPAAGGKWQKETMTDFVGRVNEDYRAAAIAPQIAAFDFKAYPHLSMADLRDLKTAVQSIAEIGRGYDKFLSFESKVGIKDAAAKLAERINETVGQPYVEKLAPGHKYGSDISGKMKETVESITSLPDKMVPSLVNIRTLSYYLDGGQEGPAHDYILNPLESAENWKLERRAKMIEDVRKLYSDHYTPEELAAYKTERSYSFMGRKWTKEEILSMRLNWGNAGNRDRITRGFGIDEGEAEQMMAVLGKKDHDFAQAVHDHMDTYWPEIKAQEMDVNGFEPTRVEALPVTTPYGIYRGGYYPIAYDFS